ncbi:MAG: hypothetical protein A2V86_11670 [Deltaproteobacteria bacterium RBG_16_49_23]|nr:MAG: hypothetical protein A2V86_11670 [Deltaproteobacteria bacterium RBG_16_49_23]
MKNLKIFIIAIVLAVFLVGPVAVWAQVPVIQFGVGSGGHELSPDEVTINKGEAVAFQVVGGGHRIAVYPVHESTTWEDIAEDLFPNCVELAPGDLDGLCDVTSRYLVTDGQGKLIVDTGTNPPFPVINDPTDRLLFVTGLNNGAIAAGTTVQYTFEKTGRFLVICANRGHFLIPTVDGKFMFGFVNVVGTNAKTE